MRNYRGVLLGYAFDKGYLKSKENTKLIKEIPKKNALEIKLEKETKNIDEKIKELNKERQKILIM